MGDPAPIIRTTDTGIISRKQAHGRLVAATTWAQFQPDVGWLEPDKLVHYVGWDVDTIEKPHKAELIGLNLKANFPDSCRSKILD